MKMEFKLTKNDCVGILFGVLEGFYHLGRLIFISIALLGGFHVLNIDENSKDVSKIALLSILIFMLYPMIKVIEKAVYKPKSELLGGKRK